jgi:hypothetical protein
VLEIGFGSLRDQDFCGVRSRTPLGHDGRETVAGDMFGGKVQKLFGDMTGQRVLFALG